MKKILILSICIIFTFQVNAQISRMLEKGKSGIGIQGSITSSPGSDGFQGKFGGSLKGKLDAEFIYSYNITGAKENLLNTDKAFFNYYEGRLTYWIFRNEVTKGIDVNIGALCAFDAARYKDYLYNDDSGIENEYMGYTGGALGMETSINFRMNEKWSLQPSFLFWYETGKERMKEVGVEKTNWYHSTVSSISLSLVRKMVSGSAFYVSANQNFWVYDVNTTPLVYELALGYVFKM
jgi:hypothetical protein